MEGSMRDRLALESELASARDVAAEQKACIDANEQAVGDLRSEIEELEMKNSSLEGKQSRAGSGL
jgi:hypothetical protein